MAKILTSTPKQDGFRMPGEFEPHEQTWMLWPERTDTWRLGAKPAQKVFAEVAKAISEFEPVTMGVRWHNSRMRETFCLKISEWWRYHTMTHGCGTAVQFS